MKNNLLNKLIYIGIILSIGTLLFLPMGLTAIEKVLTNDGYIFRFDIVQVFTIMVYLSAIPYLMGLVSFKKISNELGSDDYFNIKISKEFKRIAYLLLIILIIIIIENIILIVVFDFYLYFITIIPLFVFTFIMIVGFVLMMSFSEVFKKANEVKKENEDTV
jgi:hypothetical protein